MKNFKGFHLTDEGEDIIAQRELERKEVRLNSRNNHKRNKVSRYAHDENTGSQEQALEAAPIIDEVPRFLDEGNPNTQPPGAFDADTSKPGSQPSEVPDIGKPDPATPPPRGVEETNRLFGWYPTADEFVSSGEEESAETIEEELGEVPFNFSAKYYYADQKLTEDIQEAIRKEGSLAHVSEYIYVRVINGIATLEGYVSADHQKMTAGEKANAYAGFGKVNNHIAVTNKKD